MHNKYAITRKPIVHVACGASVVPPVSRLISAVSRLASDNGRCRGTLLRVTLSRLEEGLGHEGFMCDMCGRRVKYVPPRTP